MPTLPHAAFRLITTSLGTSTPVSIPSSRALLALGAFAIATQLCCSGCATSPAGTAAPGTSSTFSPGDVDGPDPLAAGRYALAVRGMSCPKCISNVDLQLGRIAGVRDVSVDMKHGVVRLTVADGHEVRKSALAQAVADAGFTLASVAAEDRS